MGRSRGGTSLSDQSPYGKPEPARGRAARFPARCGPCTRGPRDDRSVGRGTARREESSTPAERGEGPWATVRSVARSAGRRGRRRAAGPGREVHRTRVAADEPPAASRGRGEERRELAQAALADPVGDARCRRSAPRARGLRFLLRPRDADDEHRLAAASSRARLSKLRAARSARRSGRRGGGADRPSRRRTRSCEPRRARPRSSARQHGIRAAERPEPGATCRRARASAPWRASPRLRRASALSRSGRAPRTARASPRGRIPLRRPAREPSVASALFAFPCASTAQSAPNARSSRRSRGQARAPAPLEEEGPLEARQAVDQPRELGLDRPGDRALGGYARAQRVEDGQRVHDVAEVREPHDQDSRGRRSRRRTKRALGRVYNRPRDAPPHLDEVGAHRARGGRRCRSSASPGTSTRRSRSGTRRTSATTCSRSPASSPTASTTRSASTGSTSRLWATTPLTEWAIGDVRRRGDRVHAHAGERVRPLRRARRVLRPDPGGRRERASSSSRTREDREGQPLSAGRARSLAAHDYPRRATGSRRRCGARPRSSTTTSPISCRRRNPTPGSHPENYHIGFAVPVREPDRSREGHRRRLRADELEPHPARSAAADAPAASPGSPAPDLYRRPTPGSGCPTRTRSSAHPDPDLYTQRVSRAADRPAAARRGRAREGLGHVPRVHVPRRAEERRLQALRGPGARAASAGSSASASTTTTSTRRSNELRACCSRRDARSCSRSSSL